MLTSVPGFRVVTRAIRFLPRCSLSTATANVTGCANGVTTHLEADVANAAINAQTGKRAAVTKLDGGALWIGA